MKPIQKALIIEAQSNIKTNPVYAKELLVEIIAMDVDLGKKGLKKSWQKEFTEIEKCVHCGKEARIAFVASEGLSGKQMPYKDFLSSLHPNDPDGEGYWLHDAAAFATYICKDCFGITTIYNQA